MAHYPPQVFLPHHGPIAITELPCRYHMNSSHLLMDGSLGAETSLTQSVISISLGQKLAEL